MNSGRTVFSQLIEFLPHQEFQKCVARYGGGRYLKNLSCWDQYLAMAFAQLTYRESLRDIEAFYGTSENAVKTQIWIAVSIYVLVAILRKRLELEASLYQTLQILSVTLFEKTPILQALQTFDLEENLLQDANQLILFNL
jgi:hypothetical protein